MDKKKIAQSLSRYIDSSIVSKVLNGEKLEKKISACDDVSFVLVQLRDDVIDDAVRAAQKSLDIIATHEGSIYLASSFLILAALNEASKCKELANALHIALGENGKVVFGSSPGYIDAIGSSKYQVITPMISSFGKCLKELVNISYGEIHRFEFRSSIEPKGSN